MFVHRDRLGRPLRNLRLSVTDRCNLRCSYCMPEEEYTWLPKRDILTFEELSRLVDVFASLGVEKLRLTGGEPLLRHDLPDLVAMLAAKPGLRDLALTTNGLLLSQHARALKDAGLGRLTISLDTLVPERFRALTRRDDLGRVLAGLDAAAEAGFTGTKLNAVVVRGLNDDELVPLMELGRARDIEVRFIEYMDVAGATRWSMDEVVPRGEILARLGEHYGAPEPLTAAEAAANRAAPADRFRLPDGTVFGVIASTTEPFCRACDRSRLTADGTWLACLYAESGTDLRAPVRAGESDGELARRILGLWEGREDRGAELRLEAASARRAREAGDLRGRPHLEMHTRGG